MNRIFILLVACFVSVSCASNDRVTIENRPPLKIAGGGSSPTETPATSPVKTTEEAAVPLPAPTARILIVSIDGLRPDLALRGDTPTIHGLLKESSFTFWARTTAVSITLPSHISMLTGVSPNIHGIHWNNDPKFEEPVYPNMPTVFDLAKKRGYTAAVIAGKTKFKILDRLDKDGNHTALDWSSIPEDVKADKMMTDADVATNAAQIIKEHKPQVCFVHFPGNDMAGHRYGWGSPEQMEAIAEADKGLKVVLDALRDAGVRESTYVIISADHGGAGLTHGPDDPRSRHIPWIFSGPGVRKEIDLTRFSSLIVNTTDTFATACYVLQLKPRWMEGRAVKEAFEKEDLLMDSWDEVKKSTPKGAPLLPPPATRAAPMD